jgi:hypothetical protein
MSLSLEYEPSTFQDSSARNQKNGNWGKIENAFLQQDNKNKDLDQKIDKANIDSENRDENINTRINNLIINAGGNDITEIVDARTKNGTIFPTLNDRLNDDDQQIQEAIDEISDSKNKIAIIDGDMGYYGGNANGIKGDSLTDISDTLSALINSIRQSIINNKFGVPNVIQLIGGKYKMTKQVIVPPYVRIRTLGTVIIESYVVGDSCLWFKPNENDPDDPYQNELPFSEYMKGDLIDSAGGGLIICNRNQLNSDNPSTGIEFGAREKQTSRNYWKSLFALYSSGNFSITGFDIGMQWNTFDNFICSFKYVVIQKNTINVRVGNPNAIDDNSNSGENIAFIHSHISNADIDFQIYSRLIDFNYISCSLDYCRVLFDTVGGAGQYNFVGGHIEGISEAIVNNQNPDRIALFFNFTKLVIPHLCLIKGNVKIGGNAVLIMQDTNTQYNNYFLAEDGVLGYLELIDRNNDLSMMINRNANKVDYMGIELFDQYLSGGATISNDSGTLLNNMATLNLSIPAGGSITIDYKYQMNIVKKLIRASFALKNSTNARLLQYHFHFKLVRNSQQMDEIPVPVGFSSISGDWIMPSGVICREAFKFNSMNFAITIENNTQNAINTSIGNIIVDC